ncbi:MAG: hypothetical protein JEZ03_16535, partial [Bacteroidales bacterium]|nr:hypothetical protein [Bacteroidales bacterium]
MNTFYIPRNFLLLILLISTGLNIYSQGENKIWYFADHAGLDFNSGSPVALTDGQMPFTGGASTINNSQGELLFYSNGITVWNKNHEVMENGTGLQELNQWTQSLAVKQPQSQSIYYQFSACCSSLASSSIPYTQYAIIDMDLEGGLGAVTAKNNIIINPSSNMIGAVMHSNKMDVWIVGHANNSNTFYSFLLSSTGLSEPILSTTGHIYNTSPDKYDGRIKFSPDGRKIAASISRYDDLSAPGLEIFDFDNTTGQISNAIGLEQHHSLMPEFSPDNNKLYVTASHPDFMYHYLVHQFNLLAGSTQQIIDSRTEIFSTNVIPYMRTGIQLGPDGNIYVACSQDTYIDAILNPNALGEACNYTENHVYLGGASCGAHFPTFLQNYQPAFSYINTCFGEETTFHLD